MNQKIIVKPQLSNSPNYSIHYPFILDMQIEAYFYYSEDGRTHNKLH